jgi:hypothetical protein
MSETVWVLNHTRTGLGQPRQDADGHERVDGRAVGRRHPGTVIAAGSFYLSLLFEFMKNNLQENIRSYFHKSIFAFLLMISLQIFEFW